MGFRILFSLFSISCFLFSCSESPCIKSTGDRVSETRQVSPYYGIFIKDGLQYLLTMDSSLEIKIEGGKNLLPFIKTEVKAGILEIKNTNTCNFLRNNQKTIVVTVPAAKLRYINFQGFGDLISDGALTSDSLEIQVREGGAIDLSLQTKNLLLVHAGFGDVTFRGSATRFNCLYREFCQISAESFFTDTLWVNSESSAQGTFRVESKANVRLLGSGDVKILGPAQIHLERLGTGNIQR